MAQTCKIELWFWLRSWLKDLERLKKHYWVNTDSHVSWNNSEPDNQHVLNLVYWYPIPDFGMNDRRLSGRHDEDQICKNLTNALKSTTMRVSVDNPVLYASHLRRESMQQFHFMKLTQQNIKSKMYCIRSPRLHLRKSFLDLSVQIAYWSTSIFSAAKAPSFPRTTRESKICPVLQIQVDLLYSIAHQPSLSWETDLPSASVNVYCMIYIPLISPKWHWTAVERLCSYKNCGLTPSWSTFDVSVQNIALPSVKLLNKTNMRFQLFDQQVVKLSRSTKNIRPLHCNSRSTIFKSPSWCVFVVIQRLKCPLYICPKWRRRTTTSTKVTSLSYSSVLEDVLKQLFILKLH